MVDAGPHVVQFYEDDSQLARTIGPYLAETLNDGAVAIVIATEAHRRLFRAELEQAGLDPQQHSLHGTLILLDAAATMAEFLSDGEVDRDAFRKIVGSVIREAAGTGRQVRAYGEMVSLLWDAGNVMAAIELEKAWNELSGELPFALTCAYRSASVEGDEHAGALREVCDLHSSVVGSSPGSHRAAPLLDPFQADFPADHQAPRLARRFVADVLERAGHSAQFLDDAALVITELATNAVIHAHSAFSVDVCPLAGSIRLAVRDNSRTAPVLREESGLSPSGRGLRIVRALSSQWGVEIAGGGKTVWAELQV